jgi:SAM-dependent methyltransferase
MVDFKTKVKNIVKNNFKVSTEKYFEFERKYNFFYNLSVALGNFLEINKNSKVLDIGCGYGVSVNAIKNEFRVSEITGVDISDEMINFGKKLYPHLDLIICDGEDVTPLFQKKFDFIVYNASIFIFPDTLSAFQNAKTLLTNNGKIGFTHYPEIKDNNGSDIFSQAYQLNNFHEPKKRVISDLDTCVDNLKKLNFKNIEIAEYSLKLDTDFITDFFLIPAQSASLFPKNNYKERVVLIETLFQSLKDFEQNSKIIWKMVKAERGDND